MIEVPGAPGTVFPDPRSSQSPVPTSLETTGATVKISGRPRDPGLLVRA